MSDAKRSLKLFIDGSEIPGTVKEIEAEIRKLQKAWKEMEVGSEEYNETASKIKTLKGVLNDHKQSLQDIRQEQQSTLSKGVDLFNKYAASIAAVIAAITGVVLKINEFRKLANEREDASADVKALTGLDDASVKWLEQQAVRLSTSMTSSGVRIKQSASEILDAYKLVGSAKPELLSNKEALAQVTEQTLILASASGMKLTDAVDAVTLSMNQYGAQANEAARYTNVMAAGSKYGSAAVESVTRSILNSGVAASSAGVPIEQLVGSIETLAEKGIKDEVAGTGLKKFFLTLQTGADDTNPKVVGLYQALDNLAAKGLTAAEIKKQFGEEGYNVASVLINSTEKVKSYTTAVTDTSVATEQAAIKSDTLSSKIAQARNELNEQGIILAKSLNPAITQLLNGLVNWTRYGVELVKWLNEHREILVPVIAALSSYYATVGMVNTAMLLFNNRFKAGNFIVRQLEIGFGLLRASLKLLTGGVAAAKAELNAFNITMKANPIGLIISVITTVIALIWAWKSASDDLTESLTREQQIQKDMDDINRSVSQSTAEEISQIRILSAVIHDNSRSLNDRRTAIEKLKTIIPGYTAQISDEGKVIGETTNKIKEHIDKLKEMALAQAMTQKMTEIQSQRLDLEESRLRRQSGLYKRQNRMSALLADNPYLLTYQKQLDAAANDSSAGDWLNVKGISDFISNMDKSLDRDKVRNAVDNYIAIQKSIIEAKGWVNERNKQLQDVDAREANLSLTAKSLKVNLDSVIPSGNNSTTTTPPPITESSSGNDKTDPVKEELLQLEEDYLIKKNQLKEQYRRGEIASQDAYEQQLLKLEMDLLDRKLAVAGLEPKQREEIKQQILDKQLELKHQLENISADTAKADTAAQLAAADATYQALQSQIEYAYENGIIPTFEEKERLLLAARQQCEEQKKQILQASAEQQLVELTSAEESELLALKAQYAKKLISAEEYERQKTAISLKYAQQRMAVDNLSNEQSTEAQQNYYDLMLQITQSNNSKVMSQYNQLKDSLTQFTTSLGEMMGQWMAGEQISWKEFSKQILLIALEAAEKMLLIKYAEITAQDIATKGLAGLATAALKYAAIKGLFAIAKGAVSSFDVGGYTGPGAWNQPKGIVHSNEFVANRFAVQNPAVRPVLDLIDRAQRSNSIAQLSASDIASVASGRMSSSSSPSPSAVTVNPVDAELLAMLTRIDKTMQQATDAYKQPSPAYCWVDGKGGVNEAQSLMNKIKNNAKRKSI